MGARIMFHVGGIAALTLLVNATTAAPLLRALGLARRTRTATRVLSQPIYMYIYIYIYIYVGVCMCMCVYIHIYIYMYVQGNVQSPCFPFTVSPRHEFHGLVRANGKTSNSHGHSARSSGAEERKLAALSRHLAEHSQHQFQEELLFQ